MTDLRGVDLSSFNGPPADWRTVAGAISFAAVKLTELQPGGVRYVNPDAAADWGSLKDLGKGRIAYMFGHPATPAYDAVTLFAGELRGLGLEDGDGIALDHEVTDGKGPADVAAWGRAVLSSLRLELGRTPLLYTFLSFAQEGHCDGMGGYPLWIADPSSPAGYPRVPAPWKDWAVHQYSASGGIDRDLAAWPYLAAMRAALGRHALATVTEHVTSGSMSLAELAAQHKTSPARILRLTADRTPDGFQQELANYVNGVFHGKIPASAKMGAGMRLWLPQ
jgi:lysozyme